MNQTVTVTEPITLKKELFLFVFSMAYFFLFVRVLWRIGDEGTLVYGAQLVSQGALPYRDFFEVMGPGSFYWLGLYFRLFGTNIFVARAVLLLEASVTVALLYWMTHRVYHGPFALLPSLLYMVVSLPQWPGTNHHWDSNFFGLLAVAVFFLWQDRDRWWLLGLAGILAGLTSCFIPHKGLLLLMALALVVLVNGYRTGQVRVQIRSQLGVLLGSYTAVGILVLLFFFLAGGLSDLIYANLIWPLTRYENVNHVPYGYGVLALYYAYYRQVLQALFSAPASRLIVPLLMLPFFFIIYLPFLTITLGGFSYFNASKRAKAFNAAVLPYWAAGFAFSLSEFHRPDIMHLIYGSPLLLILFLVIWDYVWNRKRLKYSGLCLITVCAVLFGSLNVLIAANAKHKIVSRRGVLYGFKQDTALNFLIGHTKPGDYVFIYPYYPMYYFLADVKNPTRFSTLMYQYNTKAQFSEVIKDIQQKKVKYVLWDTVVGGSNLKTWFPQYNQPGSDNLCLESYLEDRYEVIGIQNQFKILRRRQ